MATRTIRPDGVLTNGDWVLVSGSQSQHYQAQADEDDATYSKGPNDRINAILRMYLGSLSPALAADERIKRVRVKYRGIVNTSQWLYIRLYDTVSRHWTTPTSVQGSQGGSTYTRATGWWDKSPNGNEWNATHIERLAVEFEDYSNGSTSGGGGGGNGPHVNQTYVEVDIDTQPVVSAVIVDLVSGGVLAATTKPTVSWTYTDDENDPENQYEVAAFETAVYSAGGFDPSTSAAAYRTTGYGPSTSHEFTSNLEDGKTYRIYIRASQLFNGQTWWSAWAYSEFILQTDSPGAPSVVATAQASSYRTLLAIDAHLNLLSAEDSAIVATIGEWVPVTGLDTFTRVTTPTPPVGTGVLRVQGTGSGNAIARTSETVGEFYDDVVPGQSYQFSFYARSAVTSRRMWAKIIWLNAAGGEISTSSDSALTVDTTTGTWQRPYVNAVAPNLARGVAARIDVTPLGASSGAITDNEQHYAAGMQVVPLHGLSGSSTPLDWGLGGVGDLSDFDLEYVDKPAFGNVLQDNISSAGNDEATPNGFYPSAGGSVSAVQAFGDDYVLRWQADATGTDELSIGHLTDPGASDYSTAVIVGEAYKLLVSARYRGTFSGTLSITAVIHWQTGAGADISTSSSSATPVGQDVDADIQITTATAPANAVFARIELVLTQTNVSSVIYITKARLYRLNDGTNNDENLGLNTLETWQDHRGARTVGSTATFTPSVYDYEVPPNKVRIYRVRAVATLATEAVIASAYSPIVSTRLALPSDRWVIKDPLAWTTSKVQVVQIEESWLETTRVVRKARYNPINSSRPVFVSQQPMGDEMQLTLVSTDDEIYRVLTGMLEGNRPLLVVSPYRQWWVEVSADTQSQRWRRDLVDTDTARRTTWTLTEVAVPGAVG